MKRLDGFYLCCGPNFLCLADNLNHLLPPKRQSKKLCDKHDRRLMKKYVG